ASRAPPTILRPVSRHRGQSQESQRTLQVLSRSGGMGSGLLRPRSSPRVSPLLIPGSRPIMTSRRSFFKLLSGGAALAVSTLPPAGSEADVAKRNDSEFFIFIFARGGWDATLGAAPRNEPRGIINPASTDNTDKSLLRLWSDAPLGEGAKTFELVRAKGSN